MISVEYSGRGSIQNLGALLDYYQSKAVFLVTGRGSFESSGARAAVAPALRSRRIVRFSEFSPNPTGDDVRRGVELFRDSGADIVVAIGGGSAIDVAKIINACAGHDGDPTDFIAKRRTLVSPGLPLVAVPTTAGTGAEATHFSTVYLEGVKHSAASEHMLPAHAILDPDLTASVPPGITASTGIDALAQGIESYWSVNATDTSRAWAREAVERAFGHLAGAVASGEGDDRDHMLVAANLAGKAINVSRTTAPHALSYKLTSDFGVPHGHAVGLTLGTVFEFNSGVVAADATDPRGAGFSRARIAEMCSALGCADAAAARDALTQMMCRIGLETRLSKLGVTRSDLPALAGAVNEERLVNNPRRLPASAIGEILEAIY